MSIERDSYDAFADGSIGLDLLRAEIVADGGFEGLFELMRSDPEALPGLIEKYGGLLRTAVTDDRREANGARTEQVGEGWTDREYQRLKDETGLSPQDAAAYLVASLLHRTAFPEEYAPVADAG